MIRRGRGGGDGTLAAVPGEPEISVVVPAFNEAARIHLTLRRTLDYLERQHPRFEILVVDDGSTDATAQIVQDLARGRSDLRLLSLGSNRGKGAAVRCGMAEARGRARLFMDADLSTPIEELDKLLFYLRAPDGAAPRGGDAGSDVVIGSRGLRESDVRARQSLARETMGKTFNLIVRSLVMGGIRDTQCGFKLFTAAAATDLFARQTLDGFAFDVEVLMLANELGYSVREVPIVWYHAPNSKVSPLTDSPRMLRDVLKLRLGRSSLGRRAARR